VSWINFGCGGHRAPAPWVNVDVVRIDGHIHPDLLESEFWADPPQIDRLYLGHVLEHVPWDQVVPLLARLHTVCAADAEVVVVGPDVNRCVSQYKDGRIDWRGVLDVLEDDWHYQTTPADTPGARHQWNCYPARVIRALNAAGYVDVAETSLQRLHDRGWPLVSLVDWQLAVEARP
jgi:predicted SAM-dependent methyltransferase